MDIHLFRDLQRLAQLGHFSQAAALSHLSQPAFSRRIQALEAWVGAQLVDRTGQPVRLTQAGVQMLEAGLPAIDRLEQERSQIQEMLAQPEKSVIRFGAQHSIGWRFYPAWLQALETGFGPILSRLMADDLPNCMDALERGDLDFVIAYAPRAGTAAAQRGSLVIGQDRLIPVCKPDANGAAFFTFPEDGPPMPFLRFGDTAPIADHLAPLFAEHALETRLRTVYENSMAGALRIRARAGDGVAWLPGRLVQPDLEAGLLVRTGPEDWVVDVSIRLTRNAARMSKTTAAIWAYVAAQASEHAG